MLDESSRILDVNVNRAREALRVIEDYARFARDDRALAAAAKHARHDLVAAITETGHDTLLRLRDVTGDVGRESKTAGELQRADARAVLRAAFGRLSESARVLGEFGKIAPAGADATALPQAASLAEFAERLRYKAYEWEQALLGRGELRSRFRSTKLYVILTASLCQRDWLETAEAALRGGAGCLQLREKSLPDRELLARARRLRELTARHGALLIINDRPDIARLAYADGVHVGQEDLPVADVRRVLGGDRLIGTSTHTPEQLDAAVAEGSDYVAVGPMYASTTKPQSHVPGPALLNYATRQTDLPRVAIGGITATNASAVLTAGATCLCVCSAVISQDDPAEAAAALLAAFPSGPAGA